jgi:DNA invertase Pin-like site-specific DNA recombinase
MKAALYLRRSTDEILQRDSLATQEEVLRVYAAECDHDVVAVYSDSASGRSTKHRDGFRELIRIVTTSTPPPFGIVLVRDVSRWGRFNDIDESAYWEFMLASHGVRVAYIEERFGEDSSPYSALLKTMKRFVAAEFSRDKSRLIQFGNARATAWLGLPRSAWRAFLWIPQASRFKP